MKINKKYAPFVFASIMAFAMGFFMSFFLTWINTGLTDGFVMRWMKAFCGAVFVAFPASLIIAPVAQNILDKIITDE